MKAGTSHDISIYDASGNEIGLILARDKNGVPRYTETTDPPLAQQIYMDDPSYARMPPEKETAFPQEDFREGFGLEYADPYSPKKYWYGINFDNRTRETGKLGFLAATVTKPTLTAVSITNADMELNSNWTTEAGTGARSSTQAHGGTYSWYLYDGAVTPQTVYQDLTWTTEYQGRSFTLKGWRFATAAAAGIAIGINDGVSTTWATGLTNNNVWEQQSVTKTLASNATRLRIYLRGVGLTVAAYFDDLTLTAPTGGAINNWAEFAGSLFSPYGNVLTRLNDAGTAFVHEYNFPTNITSIYPTTISGVDYLFVCLGWANAYWYVSSYLLGDCETAWTELIDTDVTLALDTTDKKAGDASLKFTVADACAAADILATRSITSTNLSTYAKITLFIKSSVALDAGDLQFLLDDTAKCASPLKSLNIPAVSANTWTKVSLNLDDASTLTAIISMGLKMVVDKGAFTVNLDDIRAQVCIQSNASNNYAKYFLEVTGTCYEADTNYTVRTSVNPLNGGTAWSNPATAVGRAADDITALLATGATPYIIKQDGLYYRDSAGNIQLIADYRIIKAPTSGANAIVWNDGIYIPCGTNSLLEYKDGYLDWKSPHLYCSNLTAFEGRIQALAGDDDWLYAILDNDTKVEIITGRYETIEDNTDWRWHTLNELTLAGCSSAIVSSVYEKRLWIASTSASDSLYYYNFTTYQTGGYFVTSGMHANLKGDKKAFYKLTLKMADTTSSIYYRAYYKKLGDADWTEINATDKFKTSPTTTAYLPVDASSNKPTSEYMWLKFEGVTNNTSVTPKFLGSDLRAIWYPTYRKVIQCQVLVADNLPLKNSQRDSQSASTIRDVLEGLRNPSNYWPRGFYPPYATSTSDLIYVKSLPPSPELTVRWNEKSASLEWFCNLNLLVVPLS